ncbi:MAG: rhodanese-like domain-containing protein [Thermodesulfovibrionales bacterium]
MKKIGISMVAVVITLFLALPVFAGDDLTKKMADIISAAPDKGFYQVTADDVSAWLKSKKSDFVVIDVRTRSEEFKKGHIPGALHIPLGEILKPENLNRLPKDKKIIMACCIGHVGNLPVVPLRLLGYDAYSMTFGYTAWIKDYRCGDFLQAAIDEAKTDCYPVVKGNAADAKTTGCNSR